MGPALSLAAQVFLLAAGHGRRAGGPKAWIQTGGKAALERHLEFLDGFLPELTVSVQEDWLPRCRRLSELVRWVATDPDRPPLASLQALLSARRSDAPGFVYHVDMPVFDRSVWTALLKGCGEADAAVPVVEGRRGHPVLLAARLYAGVLQLDPERDGLDRFLRTRQVAQVPVDCAAVLKNDNQADDVK